MEIILEQHAKFAGVAWLRGKMPGAGAAEVPAWVDAPLRDEQVAAMTEVSLWQTELLLGSISKVLRAVDTSEAPDIT